MINYDNTYTAIFKQSDKHHEILNHIIGVRVFAKGPLSLYDSNGSSSDSSSSTACTVVPSVVIQSITIEGINASFDMLINIPTIGVHDLTLTVSGRDHIETSKNGQTLNISIDYDVATVNNGKYDLDAHVLLKNIIVVPTRSLSIFGLNGINVTDGHNTKVAMSNGILYITGGVGLGLGVNHNTDLRINRGIVSINGHRSGNNVNISISDKLVEYGAGISW